MTATVIRTEPSHRPHSAMQNSMNRLAVQALEKMETRKFNSKSKGRREGSCGALDTLSSSSTSDCAICLEKYIDGEVMAEADPSWVGKT